MIIKGMNFIVIVTIKEVFNKSYMWGVIEFQQTLGNDRHLWREAGVIKMEK